MTAQRPATADSILKLLHLVQLQRQQRASSAGLQAQVSAIKAYQQRRFSHTYSDLLNSPRYGGASHFFLNELYGPQDFAERDTQFARVVPALVKLFPKDIVETVQLLAELHALSESLDTDMGRALTNGPEQAKVEAGSYVNAWQTVGRASDRELQIALTVRLAQALDRLTHKPLLRHSLRMMRGPARAAGLESLHALLECGFDTFHAMNGAQDFLATVSERERVLAAALFAADLSAGAATSLPSLSQLGILRDWLP
jgi:hypothetical protein